MLNGDGIENGETTTTTTTKTKTKQKKTKGKKKKETAATTIGLIKKKNTFYILPSNVLKTHKNLLLFLMLYKWKKVAVYVESTNS